MAVLAGATPHVDNTLLDLSQIVAIGERYTRTMRGLHYSPYRLADSGFLAHALVTTRQQTLTLIEAWSNALPSLQVPYAEELNPPLWEWGHVAWFQEWWTVRNRQHMLGTASASEGPSFSPSIFAQADSLYNSSQVAHSTRWQLDLPTLQDTLQYMHKVHQLSIEALAFVNETNDNGLYFWRLALFHEAMHNEASVYMAQALGLDLGLPTPVIGSPNSQKPVTPSALAIEEQTVQLGHRGSGFAFDNECGGHETVVAPFEIDAHAVTWGQYIAFLQDTKHPAPPYLRHIGEPSSSNGWEVQRAGQWVQAPMHECAVHINATDAQAWCDWAQRRLPTEAEWQCAVQHPDFVWGQVWEWTATPFAPFEGFTPHPYQEYSAPWWHTHRVLKGASWATPECLLDSRFRNFFTPNRNDLFCGFRSVAI